VSDTDLNLVKPGQSVALIWQLFSSPGVPLVENLHVCGSATGSGCDSIKPWVFIGTIKTTCMADSTPNLDTETTQPAGSSNLQNFQNGTYQYNLKTVKSPSSTGCFDAVLIFDSGLTVFPANFKFKPWSAVVKGRVQAAACTLSFSGSLDLSRGILPRTFFLSFRGAKRRGICCSSILLKSRFLASLEMTRRGLLGSCPQICCTHEMSSWPWA